MPIDDRPKFTIRNAQLIYRNFTGRPTPVNPLGGKRQFGVILPEEWVENLLAERWNVKRLKTQEDAAEGELGTPWLPVEAGYKFRPPRITQITSVNRTNVTEDMVGTLDWADVVKADLTIRGNPWEAPDGMRLKAWLETMYITIDEDELDRDYAIPDETGMG